MEYKNEITSAEILSITYNHNNPEGKFNPVSFSTAIVWVKINNIVKLPLHIPVLGIEYETYYDIIAEADEISYEEAREYYYNHYKELESEYNSISESFAEAYINDLFDFFVNTFEDLREYLFPALDSIYEEYKETV